MGERGLFHIFVFAIKRVVLVGALIVLWKDNVSTNYVADCLRPICCVFAILLFKNRIQLFRQRLSHKSVKAYATMPIGIMGRKSLALID